MNFNRQGFGNFIVASGAFLRSVVRRDFNYHPTSFFRFVGQHVKEHAPTAVSYASGKMSVTDHTFDIQVFYIDILIALYIEVSSLMQKVLSLVRDLLMSLSNQKTGILSSGRAFLPTAQRPLSAPEKFKALKKVFRILNLIAISVITKGCYTYVYANRGGSLRKLFNRHILTGKGCKPLTCRVPADGHGLDCTLDRTGQEQLKPANVLDVEIAAFKFPARLFKCKRIVSVSGLKARETGFAVMFFKSLKEGLIGSVKALYDILQYLRAGSRKFRESIFKFRKLILLLNGRNRFAMLTVNADSLFKGKVIESAAYLKPLVAVSSGSLIDYGSIEIGLAHTLLTCFCGQKSRRN